MASSKEQCEPIYETRFEEMVTPSDPKNTLRLARFLNPLSKHSNQATNFPSISLLSDIFPHDLQEWPSKVIFRGWYGHMLKWNQWVLDLSSKYSPIWKQAGIHQAIMASIYEVRPSPDTVIGLSEFWCPDTNTFLFPWGEATVTLEDVTILGGYPVLGDSVTNPYLTEQITQIVEKFKRYRLKILQNKGIKATHHGWLNYFMHLKKESSSGLVHIAFLSIWLSRFVFPSVADKCIVNSLIPIAVKLSRGIKLALGPAVLASLYHNLTILREQAFASSTIINVSGPFLLLQTWALERFPIIGPKSAITLRPGEPRIARWHKVTVKVNLPLVRLAVKEANNFRWRPYVGKLDNWQHPSYYKENEQSYSDCSNLDEELRLFYQFVLASELVGMDCKEKYFPHRVARQFGFDQDVPTDPSNVKFSSCDPVKLFIPSRSFQPAVSLGYSNWWKGLLLARQGKIKEVLLCKNSDQVLSSVQEDGGSPAMNKIDPESQASTDSSSEIPHPEVSPEVCSKGNQSASYENDVMVDCDEPVVGRNQPELCTTPENLKRPSSSVTPPPGFQIKEVLLGKNSAQVLSSVQEDGGSHNCHVTGAAMNKIDPKSKASTDFSSEIPPPEISPEVPSKGNRSASNEIAVTLDCDEPVVGRNQPELCTTPENLKRSISSVTPPPGFQKLSSNAKKRPVHESSNGDVHGSASVPCAKNTKVPRLNLVKREDLDDDEDDVVIISHFDKEEAGLLEGCNLYKNAASSPIGAGSGIERSRSSCLNSVKMEYSNDDDDDIVIYSHFDKEAGFQKGCNRSQNTASLSIGAFPIEVKVEVGDTTSEPFKVGDVKMGISSNKSVKIPTKVWATKLGGESPSNPINIDEDSESPSDKSHKDQLSFEERLQKLEKCIRRRVTEGD